MPTATSTPPVSWGHDSIVAALTIACIPYPPEEAVKVADDYTTRGLHGSAASLYGNAAQAYAQQANPAERKESAVITILLFIPRLLRRLMIWLMFGSATNASDPIQPAEARDEARLKQLTALLQQADVCLQHRQAQRARQLLREFQSVLPNNFANKQHLLDALLPSLQQLHQAEQTIGQAVQTALTQLLRVTSDSADGESTQAVIQQQLRRSASDPTTAALQYFNTIFIDAGTTQQSAPTTNRASRQPVASVTPAEAIEQLARRPQATDSASNQLLTALGQASCTALAAFFQRADANFIHHCAEVNYPATIHNLAVSSAEVAQAVIGNQVLTTYLWQTSDGRGLFLALNLYLRADSEAAQPRTSVITAVRGLTIDPARVHTALQQMTASYQAAIVRLKEKPDARIFYVFLLQAEATYITSRYPSDQTLKTLIENFSQQQRLQPLTSEVTIDPEFAAEDQGLSVGMRQPLRAKEITLTPEQRASLTARQNQLQQQVTHPLQLISSLQELGFRTSAEQAYALHQLANNATNKRQIVRQITTQVEYIQCLTTNISPRLLDEILSLVMRDPVRRVRELLHQQGSDRTGQGDIAKLTGTDGHRIITDNFALQLYIHLKSTQLKQEHVIDATLTTPRGRVFTIKDLVFDAADLVSVIDYIQGCDHEQFELENCAVRTATGQLVRLDGLTGDKNTLTKSLTTAQCQALPADIETPALSPTSLAAFLPRLPLLLAGRDLSRTPTNLRHIRQLLEEHPAACIEPEHLTQLGIATYPLTTCMPHDKTLEINQAEQARIDFAHHIIQIQLHQNPAEFDVRWLALFSKAPIVLDYIDLSQCSEVALSAIQTHQPTTISLNHCNLDTSAAHLLARLANQASVTALSISGNDLSAAAASQSLGDIANSRLRYLDLSNCHFNATETSLAALCQLIRSNPALRVLNLTGNSNLISRIAEFATQVTALRSAVATHTAIIDKALTLPPGESNTRAGTRFAPSDRRPGPCTFDRSAQGREGERDLELALRLSLQGMGTHNIYP